VDPDPEPDQYVFGPPRYGSSSTRYGSGSGFLPPTKSSKENLDIYCFVTSLRLFIFENDVNAASKSNERKNLEH
jgi:hypothetical protein